MTEERYSEFQNEIEKFKRIYQSLFKKRQQEVLYFIRMMMYSGQKNLIRSIEFESVTAIDEWWKALDSEMKYAMVDYWHYAADYEDGIYQSPKRTIHFDRLADPNCEIMQSIKEKMNNFLKKYLTTIRLIAIIYLQFTHFYNNL